MSEVHLPKVYRELWNPYRYKVLYGGRYAARSWTIARNLIIRATQTETRILCTRELQKSVKQSVHRLLKDQISLLGLDKFFDVQQQGIYGANGSEFMFLGIKHNTEEVKSTEGIDICWIEEAHNLTESSWDIIDPTIRKEDSEVWLSFNTRFKFDHVYQLFVANPPPPGSLVIRSSFKDIPKYVTKTIDKQIAGVKKNDYEKYLHVWLGWQANFVLIAMTGALALTLIWRLLPESAPPDNNGMQPKLILKDYGLLLANRGFMKYGILTGAGSGVIMAFVTAGPFILISYFNVATEHYGLYFVIPVFSFFASNLVTRQLAGKMNIPHGSIYHSFHHE